MRSSASARFPLPAPLGTSPDAALAAALADALAPGAIRSVFQPIVELDTGRVVAHEALARGPQGPLERPDELFAAARAGGRLAELDQACRTAALRGALEHGLVAPLTLFVNVEPEVLDRAPLETLLALAETGPSPLRVVLEITERALATRPADLLRTVERVRSVGWGVALDDVGADPMSLAFMPLLRPDVIKLDLRLVQDRPGPVVAEIMNAVNAHAERTGAVVLAEGIEHDEHLAMARALGATLGQGWYFGRPVPVPDITAPTAVLALPAPRTDVLDPDGTSPFACLPSTVPLRTAPKALLIELSKHLEREAMRMGSTCVVAATFQEARHFTPSTTQRYRDLVERTGFVCALGEGMPVEPLPGLRGAQLSPADAVRGEWDLAVLSPHFSAALLARDLGDTGPDAARRFEYALTYDRDTVVHAVTALLARVSPRAPEDRVPVPPADETAEGAIDLTARVAADVAAAGPEVLASGDVLLLEALAATPSGVAIADLRLPDQPLVYVNSAFEKLTGLPRAELLGRNCRFLQGADSDPAAVGRIRAAVLAGQECRETLLNVRGPDRTPWWNELHLAPVRDAGGTVVQYIGVQVDVTARVEAERALLQERDRTRAALARIEELAATDPLTGLANRRRLQEQVETALWDARSRGDGLALLFLDLDGFKAVNDRFGHAAGDELLQVIAGRLQGRLRRRDLLARLGGDEFLVALPDLSADGSSAQAHQVAGELADALAAPVPLRGSDVRVTASIGIAVAPVDGDDFAGLLHLADTRMYAAKSARCAAVPG